MWGVAVLESSQAFQEKLLNSFFKLLCKTTVQNLVGSWTLTSTSSWLKLSQRNGDQLCFHKFYTGASQCFEWFDFWSFIRAMCKESRVATQPIISLMAVTKLSLNMWGKAAKFFGLCSLIVFFMSYGILNTKVDIKEEVDFGYTFFIQFVLKNKIKQNKNPSLTV